MGRAAVGGRAVWEAGRMLTVESQRCLIGVARRRHGQAWGTLTDASDLRVAAHDMVNMTIMMTFTRK